MGKEVGPGAGASGQPTTIGSTGQCGSGLLSQAARQKALAQARASLFSAFRYILELLAAP
jgi:hypothetical protein